MDETDISDVFTLICKLERQTFPRRRWRRSCCNATLMVVVAAAPSPPGASRYEISKLLAGKITFSFCWCWCEQWQRQCGAGISLAIHRQRARASVTRRRGGCLSHMWPSFLPQSSSCGIKGNLAIMGRNQ